jgi:L-fucose mutarotase/ribose pyranase (RbsD/FucU family)
VLKNLDPILTGELLVLLDDLEPGQWLAVTAGTAPTPGIGEDHVVVDLGAHSLEAVTQAVLTVLPLDTRMTPILFLDNGGSLPDAAFAVSGLAVDATASNMAPAHSVGASPVGSIPLMGSSAA